jgi:outer membrane protein, heavy metal efflux system
MMRRLLTIGVLFGVLTTGRPTLAQSPDHLHGLTARVQEGQSLSLQAAIDEALTTNPTLIVLRKQYEAVRQRPAQERYLRPPTLETQIWQWPLTTVNPLNTNMYMFTIQQEVPGRGKRELRAAVAEKDAELASAEIAVRARDVMKDVTRWYANLVVARRAIDIHLQSVELLRQLADASTIKYAAGRSSQQDVLKAIAEMSKLHEDLVMHEESAATAAAQLNTLLDRDPDAPIGALDEPRETVSLPPSAELQRLALNRQPELRAAQLGVDRAKASLTVITRDYKPDFFLGGGYMLMPREAGAWTASIGITWPNAPWSRGALDAKTAEASAEIEAAAARIHDVERQIRLSVHEAYIRAVAAGQRASLLRTTVVPQSEQTLEVARVGYQTDRVDFLSLVDNQRALLDARLNYFRALSDRELALADLSRAVGTDILRSPADSPVNEVK